MTHLFDIHPITRVQEYLEASWRLRNREVKEIPPWPQD